jgi:hypothetical protein
MYRQRSESFLGGIELACHQVYNLALQYSPTQSLQMEKCASNLASAPLVLLLIQPYPVSGDNLVRLRKPETAPAQCSPKLERNRRHYSLRDFLPALSLCPGNGTKRKAGKNNHSSDAKGFGNHGALLIPCFFLAYEPAPSRAYCPYEGQSPGGIINAVHGDAV